MFKGSLFMTTDASTLHQLVYSNKIIFIGESNPNMVNELNGVTGSILLPPYSAMTAQMDGNMNEFYNQYYLHLYTREPQEFISTVLRSMMLGTNIVLYCSPDEFKLCGHFILQVLQNDFGIITGTVNNPFRFNISYVPAICTLLYLNNLLSVEELFIIYPENVPFNDMVLPKLVEELNPVVDNRTKEDYSIYFNNLNSRVKKSKKFRKSPITMGRN